MLTQGKGLEWGKDGKVTRLIGTHSHIAHLKYLQLREKKSRELLQIALNAGGQGVWEWNIQTGVCSFNERGFNKLGYDRGDIKEHVSSWEKIVHPDDLPEVMDTLNNHLSGESSIYSSQHRVKTKRGEYIWIWDHGRVVDYDCDVKPLVAIGTHTDITELKVTQQRFQVSVEGGNIGMWEWNLVTKQVFLHNSWLKLHGFEPDPEGRKEVGFDFWLDLVHPDDSEATLNTLNAHLAGESPMYVSEYRIKNADDTWMWILDQGRVVEYDEHGKPALLFGTHLDTTTQRQCSTELQEMVALRDKLMDILSHDLTL